MAEPHTGYNGRQVIVTSVTLKPVQAGAPCLDGLSTNVKTRAMTAVTQSNASPIV